MAHRQLELFTPKQRKDLGWDGQYGGASRLGRRKITRPFDSGKHLHLVLRASSARGERSMLHRRNRSRVAAIVYRNALAQGVTIDRLENVGNHLHLLVRAPSRQSFQAFLKGMAGVIARTVAGAQRGRPGRKFWDALAYSRVVAWGCALRAVRAYLSKNALEAVGFQGVYLKIPARGPATIVVTDARFWAQGPPR